MLKADERSKHHSIFLIEIWRQKQTKNKMKRKDWNFMFFFQINEILNNLFCRFLVILRNKTIYFRSLFDSWCMISKMNIKINLWCFNNICQPKIFHGRWSVSNYFKRDSFNKFTQLSLSPTPHPPKSTLILETRKIWWNKTSQKLIIMTVSQQEIKTTTLLQQELQLGIKIGLVLWHINYCRLFNAKSFSRIYIRYIWFGWVGFYGISTIVGYLMPNPLYT